MFPPSRPLPGIDPTARIGAGCTLGRDVSVGPYAVLGRDVRLGDRAASAEGVVPGRRGDRRGRRVLCPRVVCYSGPRSGSGWCSRPGR